MSRWPKDRACPCGQAITRQSTTGYCRPCAMRRMHGDTEYRARQRAGLARYFDQPGVRAERGRMLGAGLARYREQMPAEERARRSEHGRWLVREYLSRPDVRARATSPEAKAKMLEARRRTSFGWLPDELRPLYDHLVYSKRLSAAEARQLVEAEIPGTREHARREIASRELAAQLRHERDQRKRY